MSNKRLIDGTALIEWLEQDPSQYKILPAIKSGRFDSNQGEAARPRNVQALIDFVESIRERAQMAVESGDIEDSVYTPSFIAEIPELAKEALDAYLSGITDGGKQDA